MNYVAGVFEFLQNGKISAEHPDFRNLSYKKCLTKMLSHASDEDAYTHSFKVYVDRVSIKSNSIFFPYISFLGKITSHLPLCKVPNSITTRIFPCIKSRQNPEIETSKCQNNQLCLILNTLCSI